MGESKTKAQLEQIKECAQIAIECSNPKAENRPLDTKHIIDRLQKVESAQVWLKYGIVTSQAALAVPYYNITTILSS